MIMPFIRLISIYIVVILAVVAIFKRDQIAELTGLSLPWTQSEQGEVAAAPVAEPASPVVEPVSEETVAVQETAPEAETVEEIAIQTPTADPNPVEVLATAPTTTDTATRLNEARQSYWNGDLAGAEVLYAALAKDAPDNADVNGEFGNVLYAQRRYDEAAEVYFTTGKLLVQKGNPQQVMPLINVLQSLAPQKAASLYAMMTN